MSKTEIVIEVSGGVVQEVYCSDPAAAAVIVVDWDAEGCGADEPHIVEAHHGTDRERLARVTSQAAMPLENLAGSDVEAAVEAADVLVSACDPWEALP